MSQFATCNNYTNNLLAFNNTDYKLEVVDFDDEKVKAANPGLIHLDNLDAYDFVNVIRKSDNRLVAFHIPLSAFARGGELGRV